MRSISIVVLLQFISLNEVVYSLSIRNPMNSSSHHLFQLNQSVKNDVLEISTYLDYNESKKLILSSSSIIDPITVCCQWTNQWMQQSDKTCVKTKLNKLQDYFITENSIDLQLYLPWTNLIDNDYDPHHPHQKQSIYLQVNITNDRTLYSIQSSTTVIHYLGIVTPEMCLNAPSYVINMKRNINRWKSTKRRLTDAGYKNIIQWNAIDGNVINIKDIEKKFNIKWGSSNHRACSASHTSLWAHLLKLSNIMLNNSNRSNTSFPPIVTIFEDDALPHEDFMKLFPKYLSNVPTDADIIYIGWQRGAIQSRGNVHIDPPTESTMPYVLKRHPACLHAYMLTMETLNKLLKYVLPLHDTIDGKLMRLEWEGKLNSYAFNGMKHVSAMLVTDRIKSNKNMVEIVQNINEIKKNAEKNGVNDIDDDEDYNALSFDGDTNMTTAELVITGECPSKNCPRLVVSRMDRSRGIIFQDASFGTDIDSTTFIDDDAHPLSRYSKDRQKAKMLFRSNI